MIGSSDKYRRPEWERRFRVSQLPDDALVNAQRYEIEDLYLTIGRLRLRRMASSDEDGAYKLTQKLPTRRGNPRGISLTTIYLDVAAYEELRPMLSGFELRKTRYRLAQSFGGLVVDIFQGRLEGLLLAEIEFADDASMAAYRPPAWCREEVTVDPRYSGFGLARDGLPK